MNRFTTPFAALLLLPIFGCSGEPAAPLPALDEQSVQNTPEEFSDTAPGEVAAADPRPMESDSAVEAASPIETAPPAITESRPTQPPTSSSTPPFAEGGPQTTPEAGSTEMPKEAADPATAILNFTQVWLERTKRRAAESQPVESLEAPATDSPK